MRFCLPFRHPLHHRLEFKRFCKSLPMRATKPKSLLSTVRVCKLLVTTQAITTLALHLAIPSCCGIPHGMLASCPSCHGVTAAPTTLCNALLRLTTKFPVYQLARGVQRPISFMFRG